LSFVVRVVASKASRTRSIYLSCQAGKARAAKIVSFFGFRGSKTVVLPFATFLAVADSAEVMEEVVVRM
jgi:hypothetical protein